MNKNTVVNNIDSSEGINIIAGNYKNFTEKEKKNAENTACAILVPVIKGFARKYVSYSSPLYEDLQMEGALAVIEALRSFDPDRGAKFTTYAYMKIKSGMAAALNRNAHSGKSQSYTASEVKKYKEAKTQLKTELNRSPTIEELALKLNKKPKTILEYERASKKPLSFEELSAEPVGDNEKIPFEDTIIDRDEEKWQDYIKEIEFREDLDTFLNSLEDDDAKLIKMIIGYNCEKSSFEEVGSVLGISKATVSRRLRILLPQIESFLFSY
ncbi:MAG: sigma-70 family RNA polymerase sigma factor [Anaerolineaceae bacterium]|nr:sigma-70 family RNA polymerase sigma factor [Anaerolineaceae bacterium]